MTFTTIDKNFWHDGDVMSWTPEQKYFFIYLCTNPRASWAGIYEAPLKLMEAETGYNWETVLKLLRELERQGKLIYNETTREVAVVNWLKYHKPDNGNVVKAMRAAVTKVKDRSLIYRVKGLAELLGIETPSERLPNPLETVTEPLGSIEREIEREIEIETTSVESDADAPRSPVAKTVKHKHGEHGRVKLTTKELDTLKTDYPNHWEPMITYLDEYKAMKGVTYQSDYLALRKWVHDAVLKAQTRKPMEVSSVNAIF